MRLFSKVKPNYKDFNTSKPNDKDLDLKTQDYKDLSEKYKVVRLITILLLCLRYERKYIGEMRDVRDEEWWWEMYEKEKGKWMKAKSWN